MHPILQRHYALASLYLQSSHINYNIVPRTIFLPPWQSSRPPPHQPVNPCLLVLSLAPAPAPPQQCPASLVHLSEHPGADEIEKDHCYLLDLLPNFLMCMGSASMCVELYVESLFKDQTYHMLLSKPKTGWLHRWALHLQDEWPVSWTDHQIGDIFWVTVTTWLFVLHPLNDETFFPRP